MEAEILPFDDLDDGTGCEILNVFVYNQQGYDVLWINCRVHRSFIIPIKKWLPFLATATKTERDTTEIGGTFPNGWYVKWPLLNQQLSLEELLDLGNQFTLAPYAIGANRLSGWV